MSVMRAPFSVSFPKLSSSALLVLLTFVAAIGVRSTALNAPPLDAHPMRQADTACVIHFFAHNSMNPLYPKSCLIRPPTNSEGLFFLELPVYQWTIAMIQKLTTIQEWWLFRIVNIAFFSVAFWSLQKSTAQFFSPHFSFFSVLVFSFMPSSIFFFGQAIHPDVFMIMTLCLGFYFLVRYLAEGNVKHFIWCLVSLNFSIATRPYVALSLLPFALLLWQHRYKKSAAVMVGAPMLLYGLWWMWQLQFQEADHSWQRWVFGDQRELLKLATLKHLVLKNLFGEVVGKITGLLTGLGFALMIWNRETKYAFVWVWTLLIPVYWLLVPAGNINHQYYSHVIILPLVFLAAYFLWQFSLLIKHRVLVVSMSAVIVVGIIANGYRTSRYFYIVRVSQNEQQLADELVQSILPGYKSVYLGSSSLPLSLAYRQGWTVEQPPADLARTAMSVQSVAADAHYLIAPKFDDSFPVQEKNTVLLDYQLEVETEHAYIYQPK